MFANGRPHLVYIVGAFPLLTTTFIDREIRILRQWGVDLQILAIRHPPADMALSPNQKTLQRGAIYLFPLRWFQVVLSHLYFGLRHPRRFAQTLAYLLTRRHPSMKARGMTLLHFAEGVYAAYLLRGYAFHELHAHFADRAATIALVASRLLDKSYSLSIHAGPDIYVNPVLLREKVLHARHVVTCTRYNKEHVARLIGQDLAGRISDIHHGLDPNAYRPMPSANGEKPLVLAVGQLDERKGFGHLVRACRALKDRGFDFVCHIVGDGRQRADLEMLIGQLGLADTVMLCGAMRHERVIEEYRHATMFVLPCVKSSLGNVDGIPNVLIEAMAMQVPVISTDLSGIPELIQDQATGLLVPPGDEDALVWAMARLFREPALRERLGQNGRQFVVEHFNIDENVRRLAVTLWSEWFNPG